MKTSRPCNCACGCGYLVIPGEFSASEDGCCAACLAGLHREDDSLEEAPVLSARRPFSEKKRPLPR
jgi:hypothetical protein